VPSLVLQGWEETPELCQRGYLGRQRGNEQGKSFHVSPVSWTGRRGRPEYRVWRIIGYLACT